jgi:hypothetical protein
MAPILVTTMARDSGFGPPATSKKFRVQWIHPGNVFSVLLILGGGDIIIRALAQLASSRLTPVTFSFSIVSLPSTLK